jgi:hypothetical protein
MTYDRRHKKTIKNVRFGMFVLFSLLLMVVIGGIYEQETKPVFASPLAIGLPTPTPTPTISWSDNVKMIVEEFKDQGIDVTLQAIKIAKCESGLREKAFGRNTNGSTDAGVFQINSVHGLPDSVRFDYIKNIKAAKKLYLDQGWRPWVCADRVL